MFEQSLQVVGSDILTGNLIWERFRSFEVDEALDIIEINNGSFFSVLLYCNLNWLSLSDDSKATDTIVAEAKKRVVGIYTRNLSLPLTGALCVQY